AASGTKCRTTGGGHVGYDGQAPDRGGPRLTMVLFKRRLASLACAAFAAIGVLLLTTAPVWPGDPVAEFYSGKTIKVLVGFGTGGGYDLYARTLRSEERRV